MSTNRTIGRLFLNAVEKGKFRNSLGKPDGKKLFFYNYQELYSIIEKLSLAMVDLGVKKNEKISILSHTCLEWHLLDMAILCSRGVVVPIYPTYTFDEIKYIINHSDTTILIVENDEQFQKIIEIQDDLTNIKTIISIFKISDQLVKKLSATIKFITYDWLLKNGKEKQLSENDIFKTNINEQDEDEIASIIYTSGTTGRPKGAVVTHRAFAQMLSNVQSVFSMTFSEKDRSLVFLPLSHVLGRCDSMLYLVLKNETVYAESMERLVDNFQVVHPTFVMSVPRVFEKIYSRIKKKVDHSSSIKRFLFNWAIKVALNYHDKIDKNIKPTMLDIINKKIAWAITFSKIYSRFGGKIQYFISGGAPVSTEIMKFFRNTGLNILEGYGLTETSAPCCVNTAKDQLIGTVGKPMGGVQLSFASDGEILVKSESLFSEYYKDPDATSESLRNGVLFTGDIGKLTSSGYLVITDRKKDIIITSGGKNIAPQKIENVAKGSGKYISQIMVVGDKRNFLTAIIGIEKESFVDEFESMGLSNECSVSDIASCPMTLELIKLEIDQLNKKLAQFETIKRFVISNEEFRIENGYLTPSMKIRKKVLMTKFEKEIDAMYTSSS